MLVVTGPCSATFSPRDPATESHLSVTTCRNPSARPYVLYVERELCDEQVM
jgi:hypothetical protein